MTTDVIDPELEERLRVAVKEMVPKLARAAAPEPDLVPAVGHGRRSAVGRSAGAVGWRVAAAVVVAAACVAGLVASNRADDRRLRPSSVLTIPAPAQWSWHQVDNGAGIGPSDAVGTLDSGEAVFLLRSAVGGPSKVALSIYDPVGDRWSLHQLAGEWDYYSQATIVGQAVVVQLFTPQGRDRFALFDVRADSWVVAPELPDGRTSYTWAFDGATFAVVDVSDTLNPAELQVHRWVPGTDSWTVGAASPLSRRSMAGSATDGSTLVVYGGLTDQPSAATVRFPAGVPANVSEQNGQVVSEGPAQPFAALDGAIYDVASDRWTTLPRSPLPGYSSPAVMLQHGQVVVGGGMPAVRFGGMARQSATYTTQDGWVMISGGGEPATTTGTRSSMMLAETSHGLEVLRAPFRAWEVIDAGSANTKPGPVWQLPDRALVVATYADDGATSLQLVEGTQVTALPAPPWADQGGESGGVWTPRGLMVVDPTGVAWLLGPS